MVLPFSWMYRDPAEVCEHMERIRHLEREFKERERKRKAKRIRKLVKLAKARLLKGQR